MTAGSCSAPRPARSASTRGPDGPPLCGDARQLWPEVPTPPIDPIREAVVMSVSAAVGAEGNLLDETPEHGHQLVMHGPVLRNVELETLRQVGHEIFATA